MKPGYRVVAIMLMCILAGQGIVPGVVLCRGEEGHIAFESAFSPCCTSAPGTACEVSEFPLAIDGNDPAGDECGPCSDTFLTANPFRIPVNEHHVDAGAAPFAFISPDEEAMAKKLPSRQPSIYCTASLIPIRTTILLI